MKSWKEFQQFEREQQMSRGARIVYEPRRRIWRHVRLSALQSRPKNDANVPMLQTRSLTPIDEDQQVLFAPEYDSDTDTASLSSADSDLADTMTSEEFLDVIKEGDFGRIKAILETCPNRTELIRTRDAFGNSVLHFGASGKLQNPTLVRLLLQVGANVNARNHKGQTPLVTNLLTLQRDDVSVAATLLFFGANPNLRFHKDGISPLHLAMQLGYRYIGQLLVKRGAALHVPNGDGVLPWEINRNLKLGLFQSIRQAPALANPNSRNECMACEVLYSQVRCGGNCIHCGRACCTNCLKNKIHISRLPPTFFRFPDRACSSKVRACSTCRDILEERYRCDKNKKALVVRLFGDYERVF